jgi:hypothetical protein
MTKQNEILLRNVFKKAVFLREFGLFYCFPLRSKISLLGFAIPVARTGKAEKLKRKAEMLKS